MTATTYTQAVDIIAHERGQAVARVALIPDHVGFRILSTTVRWAAATGEGKRDAVQAALNQLRDQAAQITGPDAELLAAARERAQARATRPPTAAPSNTPTLPALHSRSEEGGARGAAHYGGSQKRPGYPGRPR